MSSELSRPPSPLSRPESPSLFLMGSFTLDNRFPEDGSEYSNAFTLLGKPHLGIAKRDLHLIAPRPGVADTMETYWDARMDLLQRNISRRKDRLKMRAELALNEIFKGKPPSPDVLAENFEREVIRLRQKVCRIEDELSPSPIPCRCPHACRLWLRRGNRPKLSERATRSVSSLGSCP